MFEIFGIPPHQTAVQHITSRLRKEAADSFAKNLASFGYTEIRVASTTPKTPVITPAPATPVSPVEAKPEEKKAV